MEEPTYKIDVFEGPLELLLSLIAKNKVDIYDIPISIIFDQYMEYIDKMKKMDMEIAGEFIVMASELMLIKSKMLLPKLSDNDDEDPRERLALALIEYKKAKEAAVIFDELQKTYEGRLTKDTEELPSDDSYVCEHDVKLLQSAMRRLLMSRRETAKPTQGEVLNPIIKRKIVPVSSKIIGVMKRLIRNGKTHFDDLFSNTSSRSELVATFMAILELVKSNRIIIYETENTENDLSDIVLDINI